MIDHGHLSTLEQETVLASVCVHVAPNHLVAVVDAGHERARRARDIDGGDSAVRLPNKAADFGHAVAADGRAAIVDVECKGDDPGGGVEAGV